MREMTVDFFVAVGLQFLQFSVDFVGGLLKTPYFFFASCIAI